jgi:signal transduction histidine kinase
MICSDFEPTGRSSDLRGAEWEIDRSMSKVDVDGSMLTAMVRESPAAMVVLRGEELEQEFFNSAHQAILGTRQLLGVPLVVAVPELAEQPFPELFRQVLATGEPFHGREMLAKFVTDTGEIRERYFDATYVRVLGASGAPHGVYAHSFDVTERVLARRALEVRIQGLEEERDLRERLVTALSHDLRTPLGAAMLGAELLREKSGDGRGVERIVANLDRADGMISDLLDLSRIRAGESIPLEPAPCDLVALVSRTIDDLSAMYGDRLVLTAPAEMFGNWDPQALRRVVENLVGNAVKYGKPRTPVTIRIERVPEGVTLGVHNHGAPIPNEHHSQLFQLYKRYADSKLGWGIGLSLVQALVHAHHGEVTVDSGDDRGTTFTVQLPLDAR